jgi:hypothetical protein
MGTLTTILVVIELPITNDPQGATKREARSEILEDCCADGMGSYFALTA